MKIADLMTRDVKTCVASDTLDRPAHLMLAHDCGCVPVVDGEGRPVGMVTDRDACMASFVAGRPLHELGVERTMTGRLFTCREGDEAADALAIMRQQQVRRLPVVDDAGRVTGLVSLSDLLHAARAGRPAAAARREGAAVLDALGAVCRPRDEQALLRFAPAPRRGRGGKAGSAAGRRVVGDAPTRAARSAKSGKGTGTGKGRKAASAARAAGAGGRRSRKR